MDRDEPVPLDEELRRVAARKPSRVLVVLAAFALGVAAGLLIGALT